MKIAMINGSPKLKQSNSGILLEEIKKMFSNEHQFTHYKINKTPMNEIQYKELCEMDILIFAFPLYIDAIPSHLFRMMITLEEYLKKTINKKITVYAIVNNGFYEGHQNHIALDIMNNWSQHCNIHFGGGIGIGAGEMLDFVQSAPMSKGPFRNLYKALLSLVSKIEHQDYSEIALLSPKFPRFAWKFSSTHFAWHPQAKKNGLKMKEIRRKIV